MNSLLELFKKTKITATGAKQAARLLVQTIQGLRSDAQFQRIWKEVEDEAVKFELTYPVEPRMRKVPRRLEQTDCPSPGVIFSPRDRFRKEYF